MGPTPCPRCIPYPCRIPARLGGSTPQPGQSFAAGSLGKETPWLWDSGCVWILLLFPEFVLQTTSRKQESPLPGHFPGFLLFLLEIPIPLPDLMAPSVGMQRPRWCCGGSGWDQRPWGRARMEPWCQWRGGSPILGPPQLKPSSALGPMGAHGAGCWSFEGGSVGSWEW